MAKKQPTKKSPPKKSKSARRPKQKETKADKVEVRTGELELKAIEIADDDFNLHFRAVKAATEKKETAMSLLRNCKKRAKEAGEDVAAAVDRAMKLERLDMEEIKRQLQIDGYVLKKIDSPYQMALYNVLSGDVKEQAYKRGFSDGEEGKTANNNYPDKSDLAEEYSRGWRHGMAKNAGVSPEDADKAVADGADPATLWNDDPPRLTGG